MKRIRVSKLAERDLDKIWHYLAKEFQNVETANKVVDSIANRFLLLAHAPKLGSRRDEIESGLRAVPSGNYIIYYRESGPYLVISRVLHGRRDQQAGYSEES